PDSRARAASIVTNESKDSPRHPGLTVGVHRPDTSPNPVGSRKTAGSGTYLVGALGSKPASLFDQDVTAWGNGLHVTIVVSEFEGAARLERSADAAGSVTDSDGVVEWCARAVWRESHQNRHGKATCNRPHR